VLLSVLVNDIIINVSLYRCAFVGSLYSVPCLLYAVLMLQRRIVHYVTVLRKNKIDVHGAYFYIYYEYKTETRFLTLITLYQFLIRRRITSHLPDLKNCCNMIADIVAL
jgi:hypothetical protein